MNKITTKILLFVLILLLTVFCADRIFDFYKIVSRPFPIEKGLTSVKSFSFSGKDSLKEWSEKVLHGKVNYAVEFAEGESYVCALSDSACSAMYYQIKLDANRRPHLSWKWRVRTFPDKACPDNLRSKADDDYAARFYVIFPAMFFPNSKALEYVWANSAAPGTIISSPYSDSIKIVILQSGEKNEWVSEDRDVYKDYLDAFGEKPNLTIGAISFMCDSDSTKSKAEALFDDVNIFFIH